MSLVAKKYQNLHINFDASDVASAISAFQGTTFSGKSDIVKDYEEVIARYFSAPFALACSNGTVAIELALRGLGLRQGDRVGVPPTAPIMTILPVITCGFTPVFYDVAPDSFIPDPADLSRLISDGLKAIIVVPMWGYPGDISGLVAACKESGVKLIEDCAHSFGVDVSGQKLGTFGDVATFSTHERKLVSTGEGGFCLTRNANVLAKMRSWQQHGLVALSGAGDTPKLGYDVGSNFRIPPLCAGLGISQFKRLPTKISERRLRVRDLREQLSSVTAIREFPRSPGDEVNGYAMVFLHSGSPSDRSKVKSLSEFGIESDTVRYDYKPLYREAAFASWERKCQNSENLIRSVFTIPSHEGLAPDDVKYIADTVKALFS